MSVNNANINSLFLSEFVRVQKNPGFLEKPNPLGFILFWALLFFRFFTGRQR